MAGRPRPWAGHTLADTGVIANLDVDPRTGRVLALMPLPGPHGRQSPNHVTIRLHAAEEVGRRLSAGAR